MKKLNQSAINQVLNTKLNVRVDVLYKFLVEGKSHRNIESLKPELITNRGWSSWKIIEFYGFNTSDKGRFSYINFLNLENQIKDINVDEIVDLHLKSDEIEEVPYEANESDGTDILFELKVRIGQSKLRNKTLLNYRNTCALCKIGIRNLLVTSHIKSWSDSTKDERIDAANAILLCRLHDGLFDKGHISLTDNYEILYKDKVTLEKFNISTDLSFSNPITYLPNIIYLSQHRTKHKIN